MDKKFYVYMHIFPNNKKYIGITSQSPNKRWEKGKGYRKKSQQIMYYAIQKYGWSNIQHIILYSNMSEVEAKLKEKELIKKYMTNVCKYGNKFGYNCTDGGDGSSGNTNIRKGHKLSQETKDKMSKSKRNKINYKSIICNDIEYYGIYNFIEEFELKKGTVLSWLNGVSAMPNKWHKLGLRYMNDEFNKSIKTRNTPYKYEIKYNGKLFNSQSELSEFINVHPKTISKWFTGETQIPYKFYKNGIVCINDYDANKNMIPKLAIMIDGLIFSSQTDFCKYAKIKNSALSLWINKKVEIPTKYKERGFKIIKPKNKFLSKVAI